MNPTAEIPAFERGLLARRGTASVIVPGSSVTSAFVTDLRAEARPRRPALKARRLAGLVAAAKLVAQDAERRDLVQVIQTKAAAEEWSFRETAKKLGLNYMTWARLIRGEVNLEVWLPRLRPAIARIQGLQP